VYKYNANLGIQAINDCILLTYLFAYLLTCTQIAHQAILLAMIYVHNVTTLNGNPNPDAMHLSRVVTGVILKIGEQSECGATDYRRRWQETVLPSRPSVATSNDAVEMADDCRSGKTECHAASRTRLTSLYTSNEMTSWPLLALLTAYCRTLYIYVHLLTYCSELAVSSILMSCVSRPRPLMSHFPVRRVAQLRYSI